MSYSSSPLTLARTIREILIPDVVQTVTSLFAAVFVYLVVSANYFWDYVNDGVVSHQSYTTDVFSKAFSQLNNIPRASTLVIVVVWGLAGIVVYGLVLLVINFFIHTQNNVLLNRGLKDNPKLLAFSLLSEYRRLVWVILLSFVLWITLVRWLPLWMECFHIFNHLQHEVNYFALGILGTAYNLYLVFSCFVAVRHNPKIT
jgi:hypothetical protein